MPKGIGFAMEMLIGIILMSAVIITSFGLVGSLFDKDRSKQKKYGVALIVSLILFIWFLWYLFTQRTRDLVGRSVDLGNSVAYCGGVFDFHGQGFDINVLKGDVAEYEKIPINRLNSYPKESANLNDHEFTQHWISISQLDEMGIRVFGLAQETMGKKASDSCRPLWENIISHESTITAYIFDGRHQVDLWLLNVELAQFIFVVDYSR